MGLLINIRMHHAKKKSVGVGVKSQLILMFALVTRTRYTHSILHIHILNTGAEEQKNDVKHFLRVSYSDMLWISYGCNI